jgi:hypothetical protein
VLIPREHGAYGQLLFPLLSALLIGHPAPGAWLLAAAATAAFLAHEALLVVTGQRGIRAAREQRSDAWRSLALFGGFGVVTAVVAVSVLPRLALVSLLLPAGLAVLVAIAVVTRRERTTIGEIVVATALASVSVPVALAGGVGAVAAYTLFVVFAAVFVTATVAVRAMIGRVSKAGGPPPAVALALAAGVVVALYLLARSGKLAAVAPWAALPVCVLAMALSVRPPSPKRLRAIGWTLVAATALTAAVLVGGLL